MSEYLPPTLCLDGNAIRRIREEKKLTQLYVAKVIGVTTDTISRWENNRYPSIKRDNVLRLAEALEVPVSEILQEECEDPPVPPSAKRKTVVVWLALVGLVALAAMLILFRGRETAPTGILAERLLPRYAAPNSVLPVRIRLQIEGEGKGFIIREHFPPGWTLVEASPPPSSIDSKEGTARWLIRSGEPRTIAYLLRVPASAGVGTSENFRGDLVAGADSRKSPVPVRGDAHIRIDSVLWADLNGDRVIDDGEMLEASYLFDDMREIRLDWRKLEAIWDAGGYGWDPEQQAFNPISPPAH